MPPGNKQHVRSSAHRRCACQPLQSLVNPTVDVRPASPRAISFNRMRLYDKRRRRAPVQHPKHRCCVHMYASHGMPGCTSSEQPSTRERQNRRGCQRHNHLPLPSPLTRTTPNGPLTPKPAYTPGHMEGAATHPALGTAAHGDLAPAAASCICLHTALCPPDQAAFWHCSLQ